MLRIDWLIVTKKNVLFYIIKVCFAIAIRDGLYFVTMKSQHVL